MESSLHVLLSVPCSGKCSHVLPVSTSQYKSYVDMLEPKDNEDYIETMKNRFGEQTPKDNRRAKQAIVPRIERIINQARDTYHNSFKRK